MNEKKKPESGQETGTKSLVSPGRDRLSDLRSPDDGDRLRDLESSILYVEDGSGPGPDDRLGGSRIVRICDEQMVGV